MEDPRVLFLFYMIEGALVGFTGMALIGIRLNWRQMAIVGILQGMVVYLVRGFYTLQGIPFGTHTLLNLAGLTIILHFVTRKGWGISSVAGLLGFIIIILSESLTYPLILSKLQTTFEKLMADTWMHIVMGYMGDALLILVALYLALSQKSLIKVNDLAE